MRKYILLILVILISQTKLWSEKKEITVEELIERLEQVDPDIAASRFKAIAAKKVTEKSNSAYYPKIELQSLIPVPGGMPGSYGEIGVRGVMISPFHTGNSIGFLGTYTLFDFGRTKNTVKAAEQDEITKKEEAKITRINSIQSAMHIYYDCIKYRALAEAWKEKQRRLKFLKQEIGRFVSTGQRSIVDNYIIKSHLEKIETELTIFEDRSIKAEEKLSLLLEINQKDIDYVSIEKLGKSKLAPEIDISQSPYVKKAESDLLVSKAKVDLAKAGNMPEIKSMGSIGDYDNARVVPKQNWAVGFGFSVPIFEGFKIQKEIEEAEAHEAEKQKELEATRKHIQETNIKLNEAIETSETKLKHLQEELKTAEDGYKIANSRYNNFQGNLIDLRETIINLYRVKAEIIEAKINLNLYQNVRSLVNGIL